MMTKVELAKMIGLNCDTWNWIEQTFCKGKIKVSVQQKDLAKDKLDLKVEDLIKDEDAKEVETLLWERAAEGYLQKIHNAAMMLG